MNFKESIRGFGSEGELWNDFCKRARYMGEYKGYEYATIRSDETNTLWEKVKEVYHSKEKVVHVQDWCDLDTEERKSVVSTMSWDVKDLSIYSESVQEAIYNDILSFKPIDTIDISGSRKLEVFKPKRYNEPLYLYNHEGTYFKVFLDREMNHEVESFETEFEALSCIFHFA